ncbi:MAG: GNAT family N-acetyltransferase [Bacteroidetes bacterium]|nr:GNAT family N-acetyltransferase [Bacteroidota bacterium]
MIHTERLVLLPATVGHLEPAIQGHDAVQSSLGFEVPMSWPPDLLDDDALRFTIGRLRERESQSDWLLYFACLRADGNPEILVGCTGYKGPSQSDGTVELGYGIAGDHQRNGYATEARLGLVRNAFLNASVVRVIAETLPTLEPSIGVLRKAGFQFIGDGFEEGVIRFELTREKFVMP